MVPNGLLPNVAAGVTRQLDAERWAVAEERTAELIARIQPTPGSEERRRAVADYVQQLIMGCLSCQVFTFGSVPLKTYLPDGDIDVTAFSNSEELKDTWATTVRDALEHEEKSENAEFRVREVQYIQAEVKIIKCLVENIVVDISFNQVGGLCTLCFLEEMDNVISQNHLFKRSIILIKAWCYYESRILGAHHGLISTYALETLVLYIFHVFNNSFTGPLEVLYRFLEFFCNFDWENFCVSLLGPVPISSLPDMSAEPPRKDGGTLLLSKSFLDICSSIYAVMPSPHENQVHPFVSKHFNVVDPLRTSNNLGRSVSKGNFFRIRSAFAFGAKRLARLLECPREDLATEVKQFFTNTWRRHGCGNRPDAPAQSPIHQTVKIVLAEVPSSHRSTPAHKKKLENPTYMDHDSLTEDCQNYHDPTFHLLKKASAQYRNSPIHSAAYPRQSQKFCAVESNSKVSGQLETNSIPGGSLLRQRDQRIPKSHSGMIDRNGQIKLQFARTNSSPELTDSSVQGFPCSRRTRVAELEKTSKAEYRSRSSIILGVSGNHGKNISQEKQVSSSINAPFSPSISVSGPSSVSSSNHEDICFSANEELASVSEASDMLHKGSPEEYDPVDLGGGFNRQVALPVQIPSHLSVAPPPLMVSSGYFERNLTGGLPPNFSFIGTPWLHNMQLVHGFVPPPMRHYVGSPTFAPNSEDGNESERFATTSTRKCDDGGNWHECCTGTGFSANFNQARVDPEMFDFKELSSSLHDIPCAPLQGQLKSSIDDGDGETLRGNFSDMFHQVNGGINFGASNLRLVSSQASSGQTIPGSSCDELTGMFLTSRDKWANTPAAVAPFSSLHTKAKTSWEFENTTEGIPSGLDGTRNSNAIPGANSDFSGGIAGPSPSEQSTSSQVLDDHDPLQVKKRNSMSPFVIGPQQRQVDNSSLTFVPTGPPVPFFVYPVFPGRTDSSVSQFERSEGRDQFPLHISFQNYSPHHDADQHDAVITTPAGSVVADHDHKSDILNSDILSHWRNLQYGRSCQVACPLGPVLYPFPTPPMYLPGHLPLDGPGRQPAHNFNWAQVRNPGQVVARVLPPQPASERDSGVFQRYGEYAPRYRGGTGTYLPTRKVPFRDRQSGSRNYRGGYDRIDHNDKEGSWANSKQRNVGRSYGRSQSEKSGVRPDRQTTDETDRHWQPYRNDSYRREAGASAQNYSFGSANSTYSAVNMAYEIPSQQSTVSSGTRALSGSSMQPVVMVYSCDQSINYGATSKPIEFGSFGAIPSDVQRPPDEVHANGFYEKRHVPYDGGSSRSSPDQPSPPRLRRS